MIQTQRLTLISLSLSQLETGLASIKDLASLLKTPLVESLMTGNAEKAVRMKVDKMRNVPAVLHPWFTYWLVVIREENIGAGLVGFKGNPDERGEVEIGYGIDPVFQGRGHMTEAVKALVGWAFTHSDCKAVTATRVLRDNFPSHKVLVKNCFREVSSDGDCISYRLDHS